MPESLDKLHLAAVTSRASLFLLPLLIIVLLSAGNARAADDRTFSVGIVPQFETRQTRAIWEPILAELRQRTGYRFELSGSPSIPEFEEQFSAGLFDLVYMNPHHLLIANNRQGYIPLVKDIGRELHGILVVKKGGVKSVNELEGKTIAFPAPNSLGASLMIRADLHDKFKISFHPIYVKSHSSVYLNVLLGLADAGGGVDRTLDQQPQVIQDGLEIIYGTQSIPSHPFAAHPRVPVKIRQEVQKVLLDFARTSSGNAALAKVPIKELGLATHEDYKAISRLGLERFSMQE